MKNKRTYGRVREKIKGIFGTQAAFAKAMGMSHFAISSRLNSTIDWSLHEIEKACQLLNIPIERVGEYFFYTESWERPT